jgi:hypothetical protein
MVYPNTTSPQTPDGNLDSTHTWNNSTDRVSWERAFQQGTVADQQMAVALMCADPNTPEDVIRDQLTTEYIPPRTGYDRTVVGIDACFTGPPVVNSTLINYSGREDDTARTAGRPSMGGSQPG